ncbi:hypothetical protein BCB4_0137 [Bacillus phage B4]|uniref:Uncharacterized protein n=1 Tax=Bacillus phage B4 TaxID=1141133 RepID=J9PVI1_9CAUD|nr:hypothetical protein BCB4_0137 [Bacillus phage B4]AEZ65930.1 hypothetical protein BCB4_0137 [Bacillus phage B4]
MEEYRYAVVQRSNPKIRVSKVFTRKGDAKAYRTRYHDGDKETFKIATYKLTLVEED